MHLWKGNNAPCNSTTKKNRKYPCAPAPDCRMAVREGTSLPVSPEGAWLWIVRTGTTELLLLRGWKEL